VRILELKQQMRLQYNTIVDLQESIYNLNCDVEEQRQKSDELQQNLVDTETRLKASVEQYRQEVEQQKKLVVEQQKIVQGLTKSKYNQDFVLDMGFVVTAFYVVNMSLVHYPLQLFTSFFKKKQQRGMTVPAAFGVFPATHCLLVFLVFYLQAIKLILGLLFVQYTRQRAAQFGFHNQVGTWYQYASNIGSNVFTAAALRATTMVSTSSISLPSSLSLSKILSPSPKAPFPPLDDPTKTGEEKGEGKQ